MKCNFKNRMFKGATVLMAAGMIATTSAPAVQAAAPSVMSIVQQAMSMGVAATVVKSGEWREGINYVLDSDGTLTFSGTGELRSYNGQWDKSIQVKKVVIGEGITQISMSFYSFGFDQATQLQSIESIELPSQLTTIGAGAFMYTKIKSISIPNSVTSIGDNAFSGCTSLTSINISDSVTSIGNEAFSGCTSLTSINIPNNVTSIGHDAFYGCTSLTSINIPDSVTSIEEYAFSGCTSLNSINIPDSVTSIGYNAFSHCTSLNSINIPDSVTSIGQDAFQGCTSLTSINIPDSVNSIGNSAFYNCTSLTSINISNNVIRIGYKVFSGCTSLTSINIPDSVASIGDQAFSDCYNLQYINGGNNVTTIESQDYGNFWVEIQDIPEDKKSQDGKLITYLTTNNELLKNYNWAGDHRIISNGTAGESVETGEWCDGITYVFDSDGTLTFSGTGELRRFNGLWHSGPVKKVVIGEGITQISMNFSEQLGLEQTTMLQSIESIELPSQLTTIGAEAFRNTKIKSINIPNNVTSIGHDAFYGCKLLESINIPDSVTDIGSNAFYGCTSLTSISIPNSVTIIRSSAFYGCTSLTSINIPDSVTDIGDDAFSDCTSLTSINIPDSVTGICIRAFSGCYNLQYINGGNNVDNIIDSVFDVEIQDIPEDKKSQDGKLITYLTTTSDTLKNYNWASDNRTFASTDPSTPSQGESCGTDATFVKSDDGTVTIEGTGKVDDSAFKDQNDVTKVVISEGITEIGNETFKDMNNLETVTLPDSVDKIGDSAFGNDTNLSEVKGGSDTITVADNAFAMDDYSIETQPLVVESKAVYDNIVNKTQRKNVSLKNSGSTTPTTPGTVTPPLTPAAENWSYSNINSQFETDKFSIPSETADWNIIMNENYNVNGLSEKQGYKSMYSKATSNNEDTVVVCDKASHWMIAIPKDIILDGASAESTADYRVGIAGEVDPAKRVTVTPDQTVTLVNQGNDQITYVATVDQPVTGVNGFDIVENFADAGDTLMNGHISATIKRAGSYKGNMSFAIDYVDFISTPESATQG